MCPFLLEQDPEHESSDLAKVKETLEKYAGALQALFLFYECDGQKSADTIGRMIMTQFRSLMQVLDTPMDFSADFSPPSAEWRNRCDNLHVIQALKTLIDSRLVR